MQGQMSVPADAAAAMPTQPDISAVEQLLQDKLVLVYQCGNELLQLQQQLLQQLQDHN